MRAKTSELNIYADRVRRSARGTLPPTGEAEANQHPAPAPAALPIDIEQRVLEILAAPPPAWATIDAAFRRKEHELGSLFATLSVIEAGVLHRRLANPRPDDEVAARFLGLVPDRRARLLAFLADARRREALAARASVHR